jgi:hypothetical protein
MVLYRILAAAGVKQVLDLPTVGENLAGTWAIFFLYSN